MEGLLGNSQSSGLHSNALHDESIEELVDSSNELYLVKQNTNLPALLALHLPLQVVPLIHKGNVISLML